VTFAFLDPVKLFPDEMRTMLDKYIIRVGKKRIV
jgi:hypothetical protein